MVAEITVSTKGKGSLAFVLMLQKWKEKGLEQGKWEKKSISLSLQQSLCINQPEEWTLGGLSWRERKRLSYS